MHSHNNCASASKTGRSIASRHVGTLKCRNHWHWACTYQAAAEFLASPSSASRTYQVPLPNESSFLKIPCTTTKNLTCALRAKPLVQRFWQMPPGTLLSCDALPFSARSRVRLLYFVSLKPASLFHHFFKTVTKAMAPRKFSTEAGNGTSTICATMQLFTGFCGVNCTTPSNSSWPEDQRCSHSAPRFVVACDKPRLKHHRDVLDAFLKQRVKHLRDDFLDLRNKKTHHLLRCPVLATAAPESTAASIKSYPPQPAPNASQRSRACQGPVQWRNVDSGSLCFREVARGGF